MYFIFGCCYLFSLSSSCRRNFNVPELGAVFPEGFVAWTHVSQKSHSHYCISIFLQCSAFFPCHLPWSVLLIIFSAGLNSPQHLFLILWKYEIPFLDLFEAQESNTHIHTHTSPMEQSIFLPLKYIMPKYILGGRKVSITLILWTGE